MAMRIDGKAIAASIRAELAADVRALRAGGVTPGLAVILVGEDPASQIYVRNKGRACEEVGIYSEIIRLPQETTQAELLRQIDVLNGRKEIHGILVQLPLPKQIDERAVIAAIAPEKDVDAFTEGNVGRLLIGDPRFVPCTPAGVMELLSRSGMDPAGKRAVVIGRSNIVGKPMAVLLMQANATVTVCHSKTKDVGEICRTADILVSAVGKAGFVTADMVKPGATVIDVGMNRDANGKLCGDVLFDEVEKIAGAITPVPSGVGPMTITMLLWNTLESARRT